MLLHGVSQPFATQLLFVTSSLEFHYFQPALLSSGTDSLVLFHLRLQHVYCELEHF